MRATPVSKSATLVVSMVMRLSFFWIGISRKRRMLLSVRHDSRQPEQMRADLQVRLLSGLDVDLELNLILDHDKVDHPAAPGKSVNVADCQRACPFEPIQNLRQAAFHSGADEQDMTKVQLLQSLKPFDDDPTAPYLLTLNRLKRAPHGAVIDDSDIH